MRIDRILWERALILYEEAEKKGLPFGRNKLKEILGITENLAREILFALENRDIISKLEAIETISKETALVFSDVHIPFQDDLALNTMFDYIEDMEIDPSIIIILGDLLDFYKISKFIKNPKKKDISKEIEIAKKFLISLRNKFPYARIIFKEGNHERRLVSYIWQNASDIYDLVEDLLEIKLGLKDLNIEYCYKPFKVGNLWFLHGHEKAGGSYNPEYITNVMWKYIHDHFMVGHFHRTQDKIFKRIDGKTYWGGAVGYLAGEMDYAVLNNWNHGFAVIDFDEKGNFRASNKKIYNGNVY